VPRLDAEVNATARHASDGAAADADGLFDIELRVLLEAIYLRWQHDFRQYAPASLRRRLRQAMTALGCARLSQLQDRVLRDAASFDQLLQFLTVQVSEMFRDPAYFRVLREQVVPELRTYPSLKFWVAGCSNGEELWSLAILLHEEGLLERSILYATDINPQALARAEAGVFDRDSMPLYTRNYLAAGGKASLAEYCTAAYGGVLFDRKLKRQVVFADHSLATDAVFSEVHLVSCRNVLIYFDTPLQNRAVGLFRDALVRHGFLGLGSRESLRFGAHANAFEAFHPQADVRLYRRY
jgi:chemotaxis protein methyltransferase CheR